LKNQSARIRFSPQANGLSASPLFLQVKQFQENLDGFRGMLPDDCW
jgi:hypothetical protein